MDRRWIAVRERAAALLCGVLVAAGVALGAPAQAAPKKELVIGMTQFPSTLHPNIDSMLAKSYVLAMARRPFTAYDQDWELRCFLCTELPTFENGLAKKLELEDGKTGVAVTFAIHPDATWGDGTQVTTKDVMFTYEVGKHPQSGVAAAEFYRRAFKIEPHDDKRFTVHYDKLTFVYNALGSFQLVPAHLERDAFKVPAEYRNRTTYDTDPTNKGLYLGPYRISDYQSGSYIVLDRNETWWGTAPHFDRITVRVIENTAALEANLLSGSIDYIAGELGLSLDQALAFEKRHGAQFQVQYQPGLIYEHIDLNLDNPILADPRVRRALLHAVDRDAISERLFEGRQPVAHTSVNPLDWIHDAEAPTTPFDLEAAGALLDEAGWKKGPGGMRRNDKGEPLRFELMTTAGNRVRELVQQVLQSMWKAAGIEVRIRNEPARVFFGQTVSERRFEGMAMFAWMSAPESVPRTVLHSAEIPTEENNFSGQNYTGYRSAEMDALIDAIEVELDRDARKKLWQRFQAMYATDLPVLPLYFRANPFVIPKWLTGIRPTGHLNTTTLWIEEWGVVETQ